MNCEWCRAKFKPKQKTARYCSDNCRKRGCDDRHRHRCEECGVTLGARSGWGGSKTPRTLCRECWTVRVREPALQRDKELERLWQGGAKYPEIMAHFGWSKGMVAEEMFRARDRGANLPYRRVDGRTHPELRKAA